MRSIPEEIRRSIKNIKETENNVTAEFTFEEGFVGFGGHFSGKSILPGVCYVECVLVLLEGCKGGEKALKEIVQAKFYLPVFPNDTVSCELKNIECSGDDMCLSAVFLKENKKASELKLRVCRKRPQENR